MATLIDVLRNYMRGPLDDAEIDAIRALVAAYDALAPDWQSAPEWAVWYTIDAGGGARWHLLKPQDNGDGGWWVRDDRCKEANRALHDLPIGIDWRLCIWRKSKAGT